MAGANNWNMVAAYEIANTATASCVDAYNSAQASNGPLGTGSITTTKPYDFIFVSGAIRTGAGSFTLSEANGYANLVQSGSISDLTYASWQGLQAGTSTISDTVSETASSPIYAGILALKPSTTGAAFIQGDMVVAGPNGQQQALHNNGAAGTVLTSVGGPGTIPQYAAAPNPNSGMTASQAAIAGGPNTITGSKAIAGSGAALTTGPASGVTSGDCAVFTGTGGQIADAGACPGASGSGAQINITAALTVSGCTVSGASCKVVSSPASTVTFSAIPGTYNHLLFVINGQVTGSGNANPLVQFNSDTGSNYDWGSTAGGQDAPFGSKGTGVTSLEFGVITGAGVVSGYATTASFEVFNYAGTSFYKNAQDTSGWKSATASGYDTWTGGGEWKSTSAITSATFTLTSSGTFVVGTSFQVYGIL